MELMLAELNAAQHTAVTSPASVLQILAPPGSGKTKTLTSRVAYLLSHQHYKPWNILCLTFTIKSSREMKERIAKLIGNGMEAKLVLGTFHSVCRRYLASYGHLIGIRRGFGIADSSDTISIIKRIVNRGGLNIDPRKAQSRISTSKSKGKTYRDLAKVEGIKKDIDQQDFVRVFEAYQLHLEDSNLLDYDDLLLRCVDLLREHPACVSNVEVVLIDEFQDTNLVQFDLMRLFAWRNKRITTVGDPDQSIYGWRSAEVKNLKKMQKEYPDTLVIHLEDNYRSSGAIILAAREVIEQDESRIPRPLLPTHCPGTIPVLRRLPSAEIEGLWIVSEIQRTIALTGGLLEHSDFAILLRSAALSRQVEAAMGKAGIPYRMVGGQRFFDRLEIKILLDYLRVISQPDHNDALARIINVPHRGIGPATVKALLEKAETTHVSLWQFIRRALQGNAAPGIKISKAAEQGLGNLVRIVLTAVTRLSSTQNPQSPAELLKYITKKLDFEEYLKKTHEQDHDTRWANVEELLAQAADYPVHVANVKDEGVVDDDNLPVIEDLEQVTSTAAEEALSKFLANVALATEIQREDESDEGSSTPQSRVTISTIHAAKGLEWPVVFIPSAYEGSIPHSRAEDTDEERRLLYVAMTRAQALLYISCPVKNSQKEETTLSQFLSSKKVGHFVRNKGPSFSCPTIEDIARILRRDLPAEEAIYEGRATAKSQEDDQWPLDGATNPEETERRWNKRSTAYDDWDSQPAIKRRKIRGSPERTSTPMSLNPVLTSDPTILSTSTTTMQNSSSFSYVGFTSAASRLQVLEAEASKIQASTSSTAKVERPKKPSLSTKRSAGQSSLATFFRKQSTVSESLTCPPIPEPSLSIPPKVKKDEPLITFPSQYADLSNPVLEPTMPGLGLPPPRKPLEVIPPSLANHRFQPLSTTRLRKAPPPEEPIATKPYHFLSSSPPPKVDDVNTKQYSDDEATFARSRTTSSDLDPLRCSPPRHNNHSNDQLTSAAPTPSLQPTTQNQSVTTKPATTFHTTSMQRLGISAGRGKTLGVKRSMNGWSAKGRGGGGFQVPKRVG